MRLAVLSDIHGNLPALEAIIDDMQAFEPDHVIVAGDTINWGAFSAQTAEHVLTQSWAVIRGNHEFYMLDYDTPRAPTYWKDWTLPPWLRETIPPHIKHGIAALPDTLELFYENVPPIRVVHASPGTHWQGIYNETSDDDALAMLTNTQQKTVIIGHTHLQMDRYVGDYHIINPGSAGTPLDGLPGEAMYALLDSDNDGWKATFRRVKYDLQPLIDEFERIDFIGRHGATGLLLIEEFKMARPLIWGFNRWCEENKHPKSLENAHRYIDQGVLWEYLHPFYHINMPIL